MKTGIELIAEERQRQIEMGYDLKHDRDHTDRDLLKAAICYIKNSPTGWPFEISRFKPSFDRARNLAKAGALIAATMDRINPDL